MSTNNEVNKRKCKYFKMTNHEEKDCYKNKEAEKYSANNITEYLIYKKLFIVKTSNKNHDKKTFTAD